MKKISIFCFCIVFTIAACNNNRPAESTAVKSDSTDLTERGKYLVNTMGCDDCHSPKKMGAHGPEIIEELRFSGFQALQKLPPIDTNALKNGWALFIGDLTAAVGPWGTTYSANITSDETGIGTWTEKQFFNAMRNGKFKGMDDGRMLLPPMPWQNFAKLNDTDIKAIYTFLKSTKPVSNIVPMAMVNTH